MTILNALIFQAHEQLAEKAPDFSMVLPHTDRDKTALLSIKISDSALSYSEWQKVPLVRNTLGHFATEKEREILVRQKKAQKFWAKQFPAENGVTDNLTCLSADFGQWKKGCFVLERINQGVGLLIFIEYLQLNFTTLEVTQGTSSAMHPARVLHAAGPTPGQVGSEVMSVLSLVGMTLIASQPEIGIPLMIGAQIFSFLFGHAGDDRKKQTLPTSAMIMKELPAVLANESIKQLSGEANSVWDDIHRKYDQSWEIGLVPSKTDLKDFEGILNRAVGLSKVGSVHDNVNIIHARITDGDDDKGNRAGLRWIPAFIWSATVEAYSLELKHNLYYAWSFGGVGEDQQLNEQYENALNNWHQRIEELHDQLVALSNEADAIVANRLSKISGITKRNAQTQTYYSTHAQTINGVEYFFEDHGTWPEASKDNPVYHSAYFPSMGCCTVTEVDEKAAESEANTAREEYIANVRKLISTYTGSANTETVSKAVRKWNDALVLAASLIAELKTMKKRRK